MTDNLIYVEGIELFTVPKDDNGTYTLPNPHNRNTRTVNDPKTAAVLEVLGNLQLMGFPSNFKSDAQILAKWLKTHDPASYHAFGGPVLAQRLK
jgi:hypothetical protein